MKEIVDSRSANLVAIFNDESCRYSQNPPYHPNKFYPEYPFDRKFVDQSFTGCDAYEAVRNLFYLLGYDKENFGTEKWNPLGHLIKPGYNVVLKPNFVLHFNEGGYDIYASLTHPSIIRAIADYCLIALKGEGNLVIAEAPQMNCELDKIEQIMNLSSIFDFYRKNSAIDFKLIDIRKLTCKFDYDKGYFPSDSFVINENADPLGYEIINLGEDSYLHNLPGLENLYGADYDRKFTVMNHSNGVHKYCVSKTILSADTVICLPKLKTHKKVGVTLNIKLLVGINGDKNYLAHYRIGTPDQNGDEFPPSEKADIKLYRKFTRFFSDHFFAKRSRFGDKLFLLIKSIAQPTLNFLRSKKIISPPDTKDRIYGGNWYGNDTAWRMALDLARIFLYADSNGQMKNEPQRNIFSIVDGIVAGEGDGPMSPEPKNIGTLIGGENILAIDTAASTLMGFDFKKIKMIKFGWEEKKYPLSLFTSECTKVISNDKSLDGKNVTNCIKYKFKPHPNWKGHIELENLENNF
ncbi:MAG: DUF362 domain-containing protein [Ignavibacteria bacterium]|jgi:uncharacterized protein (DUF362 family)|nr:DUF362 domain-containing protein [Ignavibacteria bacterium]MDH7528904.1 DUF362 domain-containing protein [Ignavibacteria bacterium]